MGGPILQPYYRPALWQIGRLWRRCVSLFASPPISLTNLNFRWTRHYGTLRRCPRCPLESNSAHFTNCFGWHNLRVPQVWKTYKAFTWSSYLPWQHEIYLNEGRITSNLPLHSNERFPDVFLVPVSNTAIPINIKGGENTHFDIAFFGLCLELHRRGKRHLRDTGHKCDVML